MSRVRFVVLSCVAVLSGCVGDPPGGAAGRSQQPLEGGAQLMLQDESPLTEAGGYLEPAWSPDGALVSYTGPGFRGIYAVPSEGGSPRQLAGPDRVSGFRHHWSDGPPRIVCPARGATPSLEVSLGGGPVREVSARFEAVFVRRDDVYLRAQGDEVRLTSGEDRFFDPSLSPDGERVVVVGLATGIHVIDVATRRALHHPGAGTHPVFTPDGSWLLFERTEDDGERLTGGELMALSVETGAVVQLTSTVDAIEQHPSVSPDGERLAFIRDGVVWTARLAEVVR